MGAQVRHNGGHDQHASRPTDRTRPSLTAYIRRHRKVAAAATVSVLAATIIVPYAAGAMSQDGTQNSTRASQSEGNANSVPNPDKEKQERAQEQSNNGSSSGTSTNKSDTNITVNGQSIEVPENGSYNKTIQDGNSRTDIKVESNHNSTSDGNSSSNNSSVNLNVTTESHSSSSSD
jgi:hypothetical protein